MQAWGLDFGTTSTHLKARVLHLQGWEWRDRKAPWNLLSSQSRQIICVVQLQGETPSLNQMVIESLFGGFIGEDSYFCTLDQRLVLLYWGRLPSLMYLFDPGPMDCAASGGTHLPSQSDQRNQPWCSMGWQMFQPDRPHIPEGNWKRISMLTSTNIICTDMTCSTTYTQNY